MENVYLMPVAGDDSDTDDAGYRNSVSRSDYSENWSEFEDTDDDGDTADVHTEVRISSSF